MWKFLFCLTLLVLKIAQIVPVFFPLEINGSFSSTFMNWSLTGFSVLMSFYFNFFVISLLLWFYVIQISFNPFTLLII